MSFYLTLPSTSSVNFHPQNTQTDYTTRLAQTIDLSGQKWTVGLSEIHVPVSYHNVDESNDRFILRMNREVRDFVEKPGEVIPIKLDRGVHRGPDIYRGYHLKIPQHIKMLIAVDEEDATKIIVTVPEEYRIRFPKRNKQIALNLFGLSEDKLGIPLGSFESHLARPVIDTYPVATVREGSHFEIIVPKREIEITKHEEEDTEIKVPHGKYETAEELFKQMKEAIPSPQAQSLFHIRLLPNNFTHIACTAPASIIFPASHPGLGEMLGFSKLGEVIGTATSDYPLDLARGIYGLYVYCDLIRPQLVGDTYAPLLRVLNPAMRTQNNESIVQTFDNPDYFPLSRNVFENIRIYLRSDSGDPLEFKYGKVLVKLHFRQET